MKVFCQENMSFAPLPVIGNNDKRLRIGCYNLLLCKTATDRKKENGTKLRNHIDRKPSSADIEECP